MPTISTTVMLSSHKVQIGILILIFLLVALPLFSPSFYQSHDGTMDIIRMAHYRLALADGQFFPRWSGNLNFGYGSPIFNFFYPLATTLGVSLNILGFPLEMAYKMIAFFAFIAAPIFFYLWLESKHRLGAFVGAVFYGLAPYHLLDLYVRGNSGEMVAFALLPLVFICLDRYLKLVPVSFALLILSHNILSAMFSPVIFLYTLAIRPDGLLRLLLGLGLSAFFWLPAVVESKYLNSAIFTNNLFAGNFPTLSQLIYSPWGFGPDVTKFGGLSPQIGPLGGLLALVSIVCFFRYRSFLAAIGILSVFLGALFSLPVSTFFWKNLPLLANFQFPWRFTALSSFGVALLMFFLCQQAPKTLAIIFLTAFLVLSLPLIQLRPISPKNNSFYFSYQGIPDYHSESATIWQAGYPKAAALAPVQIISGRANIFNSSRKSNLHTYIVDAESPAELLDNTIYFPGWKVLVDGADTPIQFQNSMYPGLITFAVTPGRHQVVARFTDTRIRTFAQVLSLSTFLGIIVLALWPRK